jgi:hypothetical protein
LAALAATDLLAADLAAADITADLTAPDGVGLAAPAPGLATHTVADFAALAADRNQRSSWSRSRSVTHHHHQRANLMNINLLSKNHFPLFAHYSPLIRIKFRSFGELMKRVKEKFIQSG